MAIRRPDGSIHTERHDVFDGRRRLDKTIARGPAALGQAIGIGLRALRIALREQTGAEPAPGQMLASLIPVGATALLIFVVAASLLAAQWEGATGDVAEALLRAVAVLLYLLALARSDQSKRLFSYHGAEHKVIATFEALGEPPTAAQARSASPVHMRCGTNFVALYVIAAGLIHSVLPREPWWAGGLWRLLVFPVVVAVAYELMRSAARFPHALWSRAVTWPGRLLQRITTREPDDAQLEVAEAALRAALAD
ncbi:MAG: DUF1385 domain-containing protein [Actinomycetota bacterium]